MVRRLARALPLSLAVVAATSTAALACGGLIGPRGAVNLLRTTTLAGYHDGVEHYVTAFTFTGAEGNFGSLVPLPGIPSKVERGGDWTLQRLQREVRPPVPAPDGLFLAAQAQREARVILKTKIDALDITVLEGGAAEVGLWAERNGFELSPDAPEVLEFYARRSPIFMAARFDAAEAARRGQRAGDGTPIHLTIPTGNPWVPLRILALGKQPAEPVELDLFLLTDRSPAMLPAPAGLEAPGLPVAPGMALERFGPASESLIADLRSDKGMGWIPGSGMWLTYLRLDAPASEVRYDLAVDATGAARPSPAAAGLAVPLREVPAPEAGSAWPAVAVGAMLAVGLAALLRRALAS